jgi:hypothetical protein
MKHCQKCNSLMPEDAMRCIRCGFELQKASVLSAGVQPPATIKAPSTRQASVTEPGPSSGEKRVQKVGSREILIAIVAVAITLSLGWLKQTGDVYGTVAFWGLMLAAFASNLVVVHRRRQQTKERGTTRELERMPKQVIFAILAVVVGLLIDAVNGSYRVFAIAVLVDVPLLFLIAKRHNWARWVFVVLTGLVVLLSIFSIPVLFAKIGSELLSVIFDTLETTLLAVAIILLVTRPVDRWFKKDYQQTEEIVAREDRGAPQNLSSVGAAPRSVGKLIGWSIVWTAAFWVVGLLLATSIVSALNPQDVQAAARRAGAAFSGLFFLIALCLSVLSVGLTIAGKLPGTKKK